MIELGLTKQESELVLSALSRKACDLENAYRYQNGTEEDDKMLGFYLTLWKE